MSHLVLSLSGGGCRGLYQAILLNHIAQEINVKYDLIVGVSVGALNGAMVAQREDPLAAYTDKIMREIYNDSLLDKILSIYQPFPVYDGKNKKKYINQFIKVKNIEDVKDPNLAIMTYNYSKKYPKTFCSWKDKGNLCDILDASSAAPIMFPAVKIGDEYFIDGGVVCTNPCMEAMALAYQLYGNDFRILNIGMGDQPTPDYCKEDIRGYGIFQWIAKGITDIIIDSSSQNASDIAQTLLGNRFLKIENDDMSFLKQNDTSSKTLNYIREVAEKCWSENKDRILSFIKNKL